MVLHYWSRFWVNFDGNKVIKKLSRSTSIYNEVKFSVTFSTCMSLFSPLNHFVTSIWQCHSHELSAQQNDFTTAIIKPLSVMLLKQTVITRFTVSISSRSHVIRSAWSSEWTNKAASWLCTCVCELWPRLCHCNVAAAVIGSIEFA